MKQCYGVMVGDPVGETKQRSNPQNDWIIYTQTPLKLFRPYIIARCPQKSVVACITGDRPEDASEQESPDPSGLLGFKGSLRVPLQGAILGFRVLGF